VGWQGRSAPTPFVLMRALLHPEERQPLAPLRLSDGAILNMNFGVLVVVAADNPVDAQAMQRRRFEHRLAQRLRGVVGERRVHGESCHTQ